MRVDTEPVSIEVGVAAVGARDALHLVPEYRCDHIVDRVEL